MTSDRERTTHRRVDVLQLLDSAPSSDRLLYPENMVCWGNDFDAIVIILSMNLVVFGSPVRHVLQELEGHDGKSPCFRSPSYRLKHTRLFDPISRDFGMVCLWPLYMTANDWRSCGEVDALAAGTKGR